MNKANLKAYAPQARKDFIAAVTARANRLGLSGKGVAFDVAPGQPEGNVTVIAGQAWPIKVQVQREQLVKRIKKDGFDQTLEAIASTWFNRFAALRYMELHDYLGHGHRVLSGTVGGVPDILTHATDLANPQNANALPGLNAAQITDMKLAGNRDDELYRRVLVAQCNALSCTLPFLFEHIDDDSELLLPDNLLHSDSVIAKLIEAIPEEDWQEVEIIGWLYQFYISEKKDQVIGKVVKSEDIPAATQLFTPNWIVQYLVQNSVGRLWLMANPQSTLASQWPYYIQPAEQTPDVGAALAAITQTRICEDGDTLNPESITVLDPACGSGHILVVAYDVLKAIYLERGYQPRSIPRLILEKNLYGLDIDDRAAQLAGFALMMKARADDRRLFNEPVHLNVMALQGSQCMNAETIAHALDPVGRVSPQGVTRQATPDFAPNDLFPDTHPQMSLGESVGMAEMSGYATLTRPTDNALQPTIAALIATFEHAKTFGSLIQIPPQLNAGVHKLLQTVQQTMESGDLYAKAAAQDVWPLLRQAQVLAMQFDTVVANPPYMGGKGMNPALKDYAKATFPDSKSDLFAMFMERGFEWCKPSGFNSMVTMQSWMFLSSYEALREKLLKERTIQTMAHLGARAFSEISGEVVQTTAFVLQDSYFNGFKPVFLRLVEGNEEQKQRGLLAGLNRFHEIVQDNFKNIPGSPIAYWATEKARNAFQGNASIEEYALPRQGMATGDNQRFIRLWFEVRFDDSGFRILNKEAAWNSGRKWFPYNKGGSFRKWYGNNEYVIRFDRQSYDILKTMGNHCPSEHLYFLPGVTWTAISSGTLSVRFDDIGFIFSNAGMKVFARNDEDCNEVLANLSCFLNSPVAAQLTSYLSETVNFDQGVIARLPLAKIRDIGDISYELIQHARDDWDSNETSWDFKKFPWLNSLHGGHLIQHSWNIWGQHCSEKILLVKLLEEISNGLFINAYGLQDELSPEVPQSQITLTRADREKDCQRLISYAIGCMMGRYSLDEPGLIYANSGNVGFDPSRYTKIPADADGIVPITDELWFEDDAAWRIREFLSTVWSPDTLEENMQWLAESLGTKPCETPDETIRRYIADKFFKDHLQTYKKRPIYWLFSSGKQGAFQALVYLHRYHEGTLARMRAQYVVPLTGKIQSRIDMLFKDAAAASSTAARNKLAKQIESLKKKHTELIAYDEQLRHYADMRIQLDLDDGVKVNYGKFGNLLDSVKIVTGGSSDD